MAAGAITATRVRRTAVEFSYPNFFTHIGYYTKKPSPLSKVFAIFWPYDEIIWLILAGTLPGFCSDQTEAAFHASAEAEASATMYAEASAGSRSSC